MDTYIGFVLDTEPLKSLLHETLYQLFPISDTFTSHMKNIKHDATAKETAAAVEESIRSNRAAELLQISREMKMVPDNDTPTTFQLCPTSIVHTLKGAFPVTACKKNIEEALTLLLENAGKSLFLRCTGTRNAGCEYTIGTFHSKSERFELLHVELKDRSALDFAELQRKVNQVAVILPQLWNKATVLKDNRVFVRDKWYSFRQLLVIAGRCRTDILPPEQ
jgi:hypothetical protein